MTEQLLIHYRPQHPIPVCWALIDQQGKLNSSIEYGDLDSISEQAKTHKAIVLLDAACLSIESVHIPSNNRQRQLQAIPYALEDKLASDIEYLHFALGRKQAEQGIPVIVLQRDLLDSILDQFQQAGITLQALLADTLALPISHTNNDIDWCILIDHDHALIKTGHSSGLYIDRQNLATMLPLLLAEATPAVTGITLYHEDNDSHAAELLGELDASLSIQSFTTSPLSILAQHLHDARQLNILQGDYAPKKHSSPLLKPWKAVAALAGIWLILQLVYAGTETVQLKEKNQQLTQQIEKEFKRAIPNAKKFTGMRSRIKTTLKELRGGLSDDTQQHFLQILADATPALASNPKISINGIVYRNRRVDIELQADSLQSLEAVKNQLVAIPQLKTLLSTSVEKDKVNGRLRLEKQS